MNDEIKAAVDNLVSVFEKNTQGMKQEHLTILICTDSSKCDADHSDGSDCNASENLVLSQGNVGSGIRLNIDSLENAIEAISENNMKENKLLGMIKNAALGASISKDVDQAIRTALNKALSNS